jgi:hypothetical protein
VKGQEFRTAMALRTGSPITAALGQCRHPRCATSRTTRPSSTQICLAPFVCPSTAGNRTQRHTRALRVIFSTLEAAAKVTPINVGPFDVHLEEKLDNNHFVPQPHAKAFIENNQAALHPVPVRGDVLLLRANDSIISRIHAADNDGATALHKVVASQETDAAAAAALLLDRGAPIDAMDYERCTPLRDAIMNRCSGLSRLLIERGADLDAEDSDGSSLLDVARGGGGQLRDPFFRASASRSRGKGRAVRGRRAQRLRGRR